MKKEERVKELARASGADDVGIARVEDYSSPVSPDIASVFPSARSLVVMAFRELSSCTSDCMRIAMNGRLDLMEFTRSCNYRVARSLENEFGASCMTVPVSYPLPMDRETLGAVADVSLRHAALAAGLGRFGRSNLVLHPRMGSRVIFTAVLSDLELEGDGLCEEDPCTSCESCVESCPGGALDEEGRTDVLKCLKACQPYGISGAIRFWRRFSAGTPEEQQAMVADVDFWRMYQAQSLGFQYFCFNCLRNCPAGAQGT